MPLTCRSLSSSRRVRSIWFGACSALAFAAVVSLPAGASGPEEGLEWQMIGRDVTNTRHQPFERDIDSGQRPAIATEVGVHHDGRRFGDAGDCARRARWRQARGVLSDWGGKLWKVDAKAARSCGRARSPNTTAFPVRSRARALRTRAAMIFVGDLNGNMMAVDAETGDLVWITELDPNPNTIVTTSPVVLGNRLYIATSSSGGGVARRSSAAA